MDSLKDIELDLSGEILADDTDSSIFLIEEEDVDFDPENHRYTGTV